MPKVILDRLEEQSACGRAHAARPGARALTGMSILLAVAGVLSAPLQAEAPASKQNNDLAIVAMHSFSRCVADSEERSARALLGMDFRTSAYQQAIRKLSIGQDRCVPGAKLQFNGILFVGGLAERLLEKSFSSAAFVEATAATDPASLAPPRSMEEHLGNCIVLSDPAAAWAVLRSDVASEKEVQAMNALGPILPKCLPKNQKMALNKPALRAIVSLAGYRLAFAGKPSSASAGSN